MCPFQKFPLEPDNSILTATLEQFAAYLDNVSESISGTRDEG